MNVRGFEVCVQPYCTDCMNFEADVLSDALVCTDAADNEHHINYYICCKKREECALMNAMFMQVTRHSQNTHVI